MAEQASEALGYWHAFEEFFGVSWRTAVKWTAVGIAGIWWWNVPVSRLFRIHQSLPLGPYFSDAPISWYSSFVVDVFGEAPPWLSSFLQWLHGPDRTWMMVVLVVIAVVCACALVAAPEQPGLVAVGVVSVLLAIQVEGGLWPIAWVLAFSAVPALIAAGIGLFQERRYVASRFDSDLRPDYSARYTARWYGTFGLALLWLPLAAPILLIIGCVRAYRKQSMTDPAVELGKRAARKLRSQRTKRLADADAASVLGIVTAALLVHRRPGREDMADALNYILHDEPLGAVPQTSDPLLDKSD